MTAERSFATVLAGVLAGLVLAVMPAASPAHAGEVEDRAAKEVAIERCDQATRLIVTLPRKWKDECVSKLSTDLVTGTAKAGSWLYDLCKKWIPDLPLVDDACDKLVNLLKGAYEQFEKRVQDLRNAANAVLNPVETALNNLSASIAAGLKSLLRKVLTEMVNLSSPDLQSGSFLSTYAAGAGIGMFVLALMVARVFYKASTGDITGEELAESMWRWVPTAMVLVMFGPAIGYLLLQLTNAASISIIEYFASDLISLEGKLEAMVILGNVGAIPGGPIVSIVIMVAALTGVVGLLGGLLVQLLALYLTGSVMAIAFVMTIDPQTRPKALKLPTAWVGLTLAKPALFFMVGAIGRFADSAFSVQAIKDDAMRGLVNALLGALALLIMGVAPWSLLKFAPMLPGGTAERIGKASKGQSSGAVGGLASAMMMNMAHRRMQGTPGGGETMPSSDGSARGSDSDEQTPGPDFQQRKAPEPASEESTGQTPTGADGKTGSAGQPDGSSTAAAGAKTPGPATSGAEAGATGAEAGGTAGAAGATAGGTAGGTAGAATAGAAGATAATGGLAAVAVIGVQAADAGKRKAEDVAHRASDTVGE